MKRILFLALGGIALAAVGCSHPGPDRPDESVTKQAAAQPPAASTTGTAAGQTGTGTMAMASTETKPQGIVKNGIYVSKKDGVPLCPVTQEEVAKGKEVSKTTYKGVEYHFCCAGCPEEFKSHPGAYAVK